jgi:hypothetical protein
MLALLLSISVRTNINKQHINKMKNRNSKRHSEYSFCTISVEERGTFLFSFFWV